MLGQFFKVLAVLGWALDFGFGLVGLLGWLGVWVWVFGHFCNLWFAGCGVLGLGWLGCRVVGFEIGCWVIFLFCGLGWVWDFGFGLVGLLGCWLRVLDVWLALFILWFGSGLAGLD